ncbi:MAG: hypothetical protein ACR2GU_10100 [Rubrobacteraceae bacterium]
MSSATPIRVGVQLSVHAAGPGAKLAEYNVPRDAPSGRVWTPRGQAIISPRIYRYLRARWR